MINKIYLILKQIFKAEHLRIYWNDQLDDFNMFNAAVKKGGIAFVGDSITDFFRICEFYLKKRVYNRGISGDTSQGVLNRLKESVYDLKPEKVFLLIGTNDIARPRYDENQTAKNIAEIVREINENCPDTIVYVESVYPVSEKYTGLGKRTNIKVNSLNKKIKNALEDLSCVYIDFHQHLAGNDGNLKDEYTYDGLHLSGDGYKKVIEILKPYLD